MKGRLLGFGLGVLVIAAAFGVMTLIDRSRSDSESSRDATTPKPTRAQLRTSFGGLSYTRSGGIAGFSDAVRIDSDMRASISTGSGTRTEQLDDATSAELLRALSALAAHPVDAAAAADTNEPMPDAMSEDTTLTWDDEQIVLDVSRPEGEIVMDVINDLLAPPRS